MKKVLALVLALVMVLSLAACAKPAEPAAPAAAEPAAAEPAAKNYKIAIYTNTVSQNEEEFRSGEIAVKKYGADKIVTQTMPDNFMKEQEVFISNGLALASDPEVMALVVNQGVQGTAAMFEKIREQRPDMLLIAVTPAETDVIGTKADILLQPDELAMGYTIPAQAQKLGAKNFVHYSFPRHMSYPLLAQRRDIFKTECEKLGINFVDATAPDPTGDAGIPGAQQFILEDVPRKVKELGKDTNFFSTNCAMQEPLIKASLESGAIDAQQCCPSPYHGYPGALGLQIPEDKAGDVAYLIDQIKTKIAEKGGTGRFSTWPVPFSMMSTAAAVDYAIQYAEGKVGKNDAEVLKACYKEASGGYDIKFSLYDNQENFYLLLCDYITF